MSNLIRIRASSLSIPLTRGLKTVVSTDDLAIVQGYSWHAKKCGSRFYAATNKPRSQGGGTIYLHRLLVGAGPGDEVDHADGNSLNNQRCNLRFCSRSENNANIRNGNLPTSGYRGVHQNKPGGKWHARVKKDGKYHWVSGFDTPLEAAKARDDLAKKLFGDFAATALQEARRE